MVSTIESSQCFCETQPCKLQTFYSPKSSFFVHFDSFSSSVMFSGSSFSCLYALRCVFLLLYVCFILAVSSDRPHPFCVHGDQVHCVGLCDHVVIDWFDCSEQAYILLSPSLCASLRLLKSHLPFGGPKRNLSILLVWSHLVCLSAVC